MRYEKRGSNAKTPIFFNHRKTQRNIDKPLLFFSFFLPSFLRNSVTKITPFYPVLCSSDFSDKCHSRTFFHQYQRELTYWRESNPGLPLLAPLRLTAQKSCPLQKCVPEKFVTLPCDNILSIQILHRENPYERNFETIFSWNKKSVSIHNIYKTQFFLFVNSITTQQFNNHTSSSMTTH